MKYGETVFDLFYLITAITVGMLLLRKARTKTETRMGAAVLILGCGDAFHLVPRVLQYFIAADFTAALGVGKLVTSLTMTVFYVLLYAIGCDLFGGGVSAAAKRLAAKRKFHAVGRASQRAVCSAGRNRDRAVLPRAQRFAPLPPRLAVGAVVVCVLSSRCGFCKFAAAAGYADAAENDLLFGDLRRVLCGGREGCADSV